MGYDIEVIRLPTQLSVRMAHLFSLLNGDGDGSFRQMHSKLTILLWQVPLVAKHLDSINITSHDVERTVPS